MFNKPLQFNQAEVLQTLNDARCLECGHTGGMHVIRGRPWARDGDWDAYLAACSTYDCLCTRFVWMREIQELYQWLALHVTE